LRRLHNEELHKLYATPNIVRVSSSRVMRMQGIGEMRNACIILVGKPEGKRSF
jgi:hypothetical protein